MNGKIKKLVYIFLALFMLGSQLARPAATSAQGNIFIVSPNGSPDGDGSSSSPWDLETALNQPAEVGPGATIFLLGGEYKGGFVSRLQGADGAYITVRGQPGERAILVTPSDRPALQFANTAYVTFQDLEITGPDETRSNSRDESAYGIQVDQGSYSHHIKLVNCIIHDVQSQGIAWWQALVDAEIYGCLFFYNGTSQFDHGIYAHNVTGTKVFKHNFVFDNASYGFHGYAETAEKGLNNFVLQGNTLFDNGSIGVNDSNGKRGVFKSNILMGGLTPAVNAVIDGNLTYYPGDEGASLSLGNKAGSQGARVTNNYFAGGSLAITGGASGLNMSGNTVYAPGGFEGFDPATYPGNTWLADQPPHARLFVVPNEYDRSRVHLTVFNWSGMDQVPLTAADLAATSIRPGQAYELRNVQDYFGDVIEGTFDGNVLLLPMHGHSVARPNGLAFEPDSTFPEFGAFVLILK